MIKYYVWSGEHRLVKLADNPHAAAIDLVRYVLRNKKILRARVRFGLQIFVTEHGFSTHGFSTGPRVEVTSYRTESIVDDIKKPT